MNLTFLLKTLIYFQNQYKKLFKIMYLFLNKYLWSFSKLTIMWTNNQKVKYLKNQNRSVYRVFKAESENIYNDCFYKLFIYKILKKHSYTSDCVVCKLYIIVIIMHNVILFRTPYVCIFTAKKLKELLLSG